MQASAKKIGEGVRDEVTQEVARVIGVEPGSSLCRVRAGSGEIVEAERAASCLVAPAAGDVVLLARPRLEAAFVLAVLRRADAETPTPVDVEGGLDLRTASGRIRLAAQDGIDVVTPGSVGVSAGSVEVNAVKGEVAIQALNFVGAAVRAEIDRIKIVAARFDSVIERVSQRIKRSYRTVEELDRLRASSIDYRAEKTMSLHAEHALVTADELVKMDAEQIHLG